MNLNNFSPAGGIGTTAQTVIPAWFLVRIKATRYLSLWNVAPNGGGTIWLNYNGEAAVDAPGCYPLYPGQSQIFEWDLPNNQISAIATVAGTPLTVMVA